MLYILRPFRLKYVQLLSAHKEPSSPKKDFFIQRCKWACFKMAGSKSEKISETSEKKNTKLCEKRWKGKNSAPTGFKEEIKMSCRRCAEGWNVTLKSNLRIIFFSFEISFCENRCWEEIVMGGSCLNF